MSASKKSAPLHINKRPKDDTKDNDEANDAKQMTDEIAFTRYVQDASSRGLANSQVRNPRKKGRRSPKRYAVRQSAKNNAVSEPPAQYPAVDSQDKKRESEDDDESEDMFDPSKKDKQEVTAGTDQGDSKTDEVCDMDDGDDEMPELPDEEDDDDDDDDDEKYAQQDDHSQLVLELTESQKDEIMAEYKAQQSIVQRLIRENMLEMDEVKLTLNKKLENLQGERVKLLKQQQDLERKIDARLKKLEEERGKLSTMKAMRMKIIELEKRNHELDGRTRDLDNRVRRMSDVILELFGEHDNRVLEVEQCFEGFAERVRRMSAFVEGHVAAEETRNNDEDKPEHNDDE